MKKSFKITRLLIIPLLLSILATLSSIAYKGTWSTTDGNSCCIPNCDQIHCVTPQASCDFHPECFSDYTTAGFPFAYLYDSPGTSDVGTIGIEDLSFGWLLIDLILFFIIFFSIATFIKKSPH